MEQQHDDQGLRWLMSSDVCKHCSSAACLEVCPTGALFRTEFSTVVVQPDICNGCGYCVPACPFGVIDRREDDGRAFKCTLCYDRLRDGLEPACATACPTDSIQFGELGELRERASARVATLHEAGVADARLYLEDETDGVGGAGAFFLLLDEPEVYGLPPDPVSTTRDLPTLWRAAALRRRDAGGRGGGRVRGRPPVSGPADGGRPDGDRRSPEGSGEPRRGAPVSRVRGSMVPEAEFRSYYGRPIIKEPVWTWEIPWYFFSRRPGRGLGLARAGGAAGGQPPAGPERLDGLGAPR